MAGPWDPHNVLGKQADPLGSRGRGYGLKGRTPRNLSPTGNTPLAVRPPASKSQAQRALLLAALAAQITGGTTRIAGLQGPEADGRHAAGDDVVRAVAVARGWGTRVKIFGDLLVVDPRSGAASDTYSVGESGTLARLSTALLALRGEGHEAVTIQGSGSLLARRSDALFEALRECGAVLEPQGNEPSGWPCRVQATAVPARIELRSPCSSQELTSLLFALAQRPGPRELRVFGEIPSRPYVDLSLAMLSAFQVDVREPEPGRFVFFGGALRAPERTLFLEPDASSAAVALAAGCLSGSPIRIPGLRATSDQGDVAISQHLAAFGCHVSTGGMLHARGFPLHGASLDLIRTPDLAPVLAAVGFALALRASEQSLASDEMTTRLTGLETLPLKESSRIEVLAEMGLALGLDVRSDERSLEIRPSALRSDIGFREIHLETAGDHRMVFAAALVSLVHPRIRISSPAAVEKSWPGFWQELARIA